MKFTIKIIVLLTVLFIFVAWIVLQAIAGLQNQFQPLQYGSIVVAEVLC